MLYVTPVVILILFFFSRIGKGKYSILFYNFAVIWLIIYSGLRDPFIYPDNGSYYDFFMGYTSEFEENFGLGYGLLNFISRRFSSSFYFLLIVISLIVITIYTRCIKKYSPYIWLSLYIYLLLNYYPSFFLLRQYLAMAVFLFSLKYVVKRNPIKYAICILIALSFHLSALVVAPFYYLYGIKYSKRNMLFLFFASIVVVITFMGLKNIVGMFSAYYVNYFDMENETPAWQRALMKVYIGALYLYVLKRDFYYKGINRIVFYSLLLNVIICIAAMNMFGVFRLRDYFSLADFIGIPIIMRGISMHNKRKKVILYGAMIIYIVLLFISFIGYINGGNMNNSYQFFWNSTDFRVIKE